MKRTHTILSESIVDDDNSTTVLTTLLPPQIPPPWIEIPYEVWQLFIFPTTDKTKLMYEVEFEIFLSWMTVSKWFHGLITSTFNRITSIPLSIWKIMTPEITKKFGFTQISGIKNYINTRFSDLERTTSFKRLNLCWMEKIYRWTEFPITSLQNHKHIESLSVQCLSSEITYEHIQMLTNLTNLRLGHNKRISVHHLTNFTNLTSLKLGNHNIITCDTLKNLTNLKTLEIVNSSLNASISSLTNLTQLTLTCLGHNIMHDMKNISKLPKLEKLCIHIMRLTAQVVGTIGDYILVFQKLAFHVELPTICELNIITQDRILITRDMLTRPLWFTDNADPDNIPVYTNLRSLHIGDCIIFTDQHIEKLTNLTTLSLGMNTLITDQSISKLTNLRSLSLEYNEMITDSSLSLLTLLTELNLCNNNLITNKSLSLLTELRTLNLNRVQGTNISGKSLRGLTNLTDLDITASYTITDDDIKHLYKLRRLILTKTWYITEDGVSNLTNLVILRIPSEEGSMMSNIFDLCHRHRK